MDIRLYFHKFWDTFDKYDNVWVWILKQNHNVTVVDSNPNLVFSMGATKPFPDVFTIYYSNEPFFPNLNTLGKVADHFLSNFFIDIPNHTRLPSYYMYIYEFIRSKQIESMEFFHQTNRLIPEKTHFCSFVSRSMKGKRGDFFKKLSEYKQVDTNMSPYNHFTLPYDNSAFSSSKPKINFIKKYKFNIAFENHFRGDHPCFPNAIKENGFLTDMGGLISEKLVEPFISGTIPLYWGSSMVSDDFNSDTFINYYDYKSEDEMIEHIIELDKDDEKYNEYFSSHIYSNINGNVLSLDYLVSIFEPIIAHI